MTAVMLETALSYKTNRENEAMDLFDKVIKKEKESLEDSEQFIKAKEQSILELARMYASKKMDKELQHLIINTRGFLLTISKAKAAKMVRALVDIYIEMDMKSGFEIELCLECIQWAKSEKRIYLRQSLEALLISLYFEVGKYSEGLDLVRTLLYELKQLDDKSLLVEVQLYESKIYNAIHNLSKARGALTSARTTATTIYCAPKVQARLDLQTGILHAAEDKDYKTAFSYFYEAFEGFDSINSPTALTALKYMLLCKIIMDAPDDVTSIVTGKLALKYSGRDINALKAVASSYKNKLLVEYKECLKEYHTELVQDPVINHHLKKLYEKLFENNLLRIVEPFKTVQIDKIARLINLPRSEVEPKLSTMILDKQLNGTLDQGSGILELFDSCDLDENYQTIIETVQSLEKVMNSLYDKAKQLTCL